MLADILFLFEKIIQKLCWRIQEISPPQLRAGLGKGTFSGLLIIEANKLMIQIIPAPVLSKTKVKMQIGD